MLRASIFCSICAAAAGYSLGVRAAARRVIRGGAASIHSSRVPDNAISMNKAGLCSKLTVPADLLDKTDVFIFDCQCCVDRQSHLLAVVLYASLSICRVLLLRRCRATAATIATNCYSHATSPPQPVRFLAAQATE